MVAVVPTNSPTQPDPRLLGRGISDHQRHRLTRADYHRMAAAGILGEDDPVELIDGELVEMAPIGSEHAGTLAHLLSFFLGSNSVLFVQNPLVLDDHNEPEPDLLLLRFRQDYYKRAKPRPDDVLLLVEVADSSIDYDRAVKLSLYAHHGIAEVWIINLRDRVVEIHRDPDGEGYRNRLIARGGDALRPERAPGVSIAVADLLA